MPDSVRRSSVAAIGVIVLAPAADPSREGFAPFLPSVGGYSAAGRLLQSGPRRTRGARDDNGGYETDAELRKHLSSHWASGNRVDDRVRRSARDRWRGVGRRLVAAPRHQQPGAGHAEAARQLQAKGQTGKTGKL